MTLRVGVIGTGMIGQDHIRRMTTVLAGVSVTAVTDVDADTAKKVAEGLPGVTLHTTGEELIADPAVDAVVVCSWGPTHEQYVLASIAAGKPVFCEKPLATTQGACLRIVHAEVAAGRRLVQVGYMRRYDAAYRALKRVVDSGDIGTPLMMHCAHRNASVPSFYEKESAITDTAVHEIDMVRWMFGEEITAARVLIPRKSRNGGPLQDPLLLILEMAGGALVDVEISVNIRYGYDIRGEVVGEDGTAALGELSPVSVRRAGKLMTPVPVDWRERFLAAYDVEIQEWVDSLARPASPAGSVAGSASPPAADFVAGSVAGSVFPADSVSSSSATSSSSSSAVSAALSSAVSSSGAVRAGFAGGAPVGPSAWDGYAAAVVSDAGVEALRTGERVPVALGPRPALYDEVPS